MLWKSSVILGRLGRFSVCYRLVIQLINNTDLFLTILEARKSKVPADTVSSGCLFSGS